jgi:toxin ParE1/3/4
MSYRLSAAADADLVDIYLDGVLRFGVDAAERYQAGLLRALSLIGENPGLGRLHDELVPPMRAHPHRAHLILYDLDADDAPVIIRRIVAQRRNWRALLLG